MRETSVNTVAWDRRLSSEERLVALVIGSLTREPKHGLIQYSGRDAFGESLLGLALPGRR